MSGSENNNVKGKTKEGEVKDTGATVSSASKGDSPIAVKAFQEKIRNQSKASSSKDNVSRTGSKGKSYSSRSEREVVDRRDPAEVLKRKLHSDSKKGGRNSKSAFSIRNYTRVGSDVFKKPRSDRVYNADCSGWPYSNISEEERERDNTAD